VFSGLIANEVENATFSVETDTTLDCLDINVLVEEQDFKMIESETETSTSATANKSDPIPIAYKKKAVEFWRNEGGKQRSFKNVQHRFKKLKRCEELYRWEKQVELGGTSIEKMKFIVRETYRTFQQKRAMNKQVHDIDIRKWALKNARLVHHDKFRASKFWLRTFKKQFNIVSRKVCKFITIKKQVDEEEIIANATMFVGEVADLIETYGPECVFNTDQSGFYEEFHSGRTLHAKGDEVIVGEAQSANSMTHSYTVQPIISADGCLLPKLLVVLREVGGNFGPLVKKTT